MTFKKGDPLTKILGARGGSNGHTGGFYVNRELAKIAGSKGGKISKRGKGKKTLNEHKLNYEEIK